MMRLLRRNSSETESTSTRREIKRLLLFLLVAGLVASIAWAALMAFGTAFDTMGSFREGLLRAVGFGSVLIAGWVIAFAAALAFRREWLRRYNIWVASAALVAAGIGALSFLSPSEGLLGWFALSGEVTPGGRAGEMIIGSGGVAGWLRVIAVLAVAGALFALPAFRMVGDAMPSLSNRRGERGAEPFVVGPQFPEDEDMEDDTRTTQVPFGGVSSNPAGFGREPSSWYTNSEPIWAREASRIRPAVGSDASYTDSGRSQPRIFDSRNMPIHSAPVPSLANYLHGMKGSDSVEAGIKSALAAPPEPEPATTESQPSGNGDLFKPLGLSKLPEPVFAFTTEPGLAAELTQEDEPGVEDMPASETPDLEESDVPLSESADLEEFDDRDEEDADEYIDDEDFDFDSDSHAGMANGSQNIPEAVESDSIVMSGESDSGSVVVGDSGQEDFFMSHLDSGPAVVEASEQQSFESDGSNGDLSGLDLPLAGELSSPLLEYDDSDRGDMLMTDFDDLSDDEPAELSGREDGSDVGDSLTNLGSSATFVDVSDQASFDGSIIETTSMSDNDPETVVMDEFDPDFLNDSDPPTPTPAQPGAPFKANKYWAMDSDGSPPDSEPPSLGFDRGEEAGASPVTVPVTPAAWRKPSMRMLNTAPSNSITEEEQRVTADAITRTLGDYGIEVGVEDIRPGPTVTMYGLTPGWVRKNKTVKQVDDDGMPLKDDRGRLVTKQVEEKTRVKVDSILAREKDLSLALKTPSIRLETPAMGKSLIGIEVPNPNPSLVTLRSIMESSEFQDISAGGAHLPVALGQGSGGEPVVFDLAKMPHLLVAGATGSGKSVCLNAIVSCLITEKTPAEMRMLLVDPKRVELTPYNGIPHLLAPVVVETDTVVGYLKGLIREMFDRYRRMEEVGVRNIEAYNSRMPDKMPFLCVIIDELADLMMTAAVDVEQSICRLAQLGRATGIHMIIATQRPSVDVLTGLIKANFPSRISFGVTSQVDSRTILDTGGADKLLGRGDMLYLPLDASKPSRVQSVFIGDSEIEKLVNFWQSTPGLPLEEIDLLGGGEAEMGDEPDIDDPDRDEMIDKAIEMALSHRKLSTSLLQRRLRIGYPRAARLMDQLEEEGIVGPGDGSKSRDVILNQN